MGNSDWSNMIQHRIFDTRPDTEFKLTLLGRNLSTLRFPTTREDAGQMASPDLTWSPRANSPARFACGPVLCCRLHSLHIAHFRGFLLFHCSPTLYALIYRRVSALIDRPLLPPEP